jgi:hypothetical protein
MNGAFIDDNMKPLEHAGILPRVACLLQKDMERNQKLGRPLNIEVSALEIYCEKIRDMLNPQPIQVYLNLQNSSSKKVNLVGQTWIPIHGAYDFLDQIELSQSKRIFKNNGLNERSSRSHHVFQIKIDTFDKVGKRVQSLLNIVDLAGSEGSKVREMIENSKSPLSPLSSTKSKLKAGGKF